MAVHGASALKQGLRAVEERLCVLTPKGRGTDEPTMLGAPHFRIYLMLPVGWRSFPGDGRPPGR